MKTSTIGPPGHHFEAVTLMAWVYISAAKAGGDPFMRMSKTGSWASGFALSLMQGSQIRLTVWWEYIQYICET